MAYRGGLFRTSLSAALYAVVLSVFMNCGACSREVMVHEYDKGALAALEKYKAQYKLNRDGRVIEIKLEGQDVDDAALPHLRDLTELQVISLYGASITDTGLLNLEHLGRLQSLGLGRTQISDRGLAHVSRIPNLKWLWITENKKATKRGIAHLQKVRPQLTIYK